MPYSGLTSKFIPAYVGNYTKGRRSEISEITIHHMAGNLSIETLGNMWQRVGRNGSSHYGVNGTQIGCYVDEGDTAWCNGNWESNKRAISIETANNSGEPNWTVSDTTFDTLVKLVADIAKRNNLGKLVKGKNLTWHQMYAATACPGPYLLSKIDELVERANAVNDADNVSRTFVKNCVPLAQECEEKYKLLSSLTLAQAIVETGYNDEKGDSSLSELAINANNLFGIKATADWTGEIYTKQTQEWDGEKYITITANFRKYPTMRACFEDRALKLTTMDRYKNLVGCYDIELAAKYIQQDGWATSPTYTDTLLDRVKKYDLTQYDLHKKEVKSMKLKIGFASSGDIWTIKNKLKELSITDYTENDGYIITNISLTSGDVATIQELCESLGIPCVEYVEENDDMAKLKERLSNAQKEIEKQAKDISVLENIIRNAADILNSVI